MKRRLRFALVACVALAACTDSGRPGDPAPPANPTSPTGATILLRPRARVPGTDDVRVDVLARGIHDLHGIAFRLAWDPHALGFVEGETSRAWSRASFSIAKEASPGLLLAAWTEQGEIGLDASREVVLGTLRFQPREGTSATFTFKTERCRAVDKKGAPLTVAWMNADAAQPIP